MEGSQEEALPGRVARNTFLAAVIVAWAVLRFCHATITDDAFITFEYARNLVAGNGLVFEPGERVLGTTAPAFALFIAVGMALGVAPWLWALAADIVWGGALFWFLSRLFTEARLWEGFAAAALLILLAADATLPVEGMETGLYMACVAGGLWALGVRKSTVAAAFFAAGAVMLRPDGVCLAGVAAWQSLRERSRFADVVRDLWPFALIGVQALMLTIFYGAPVPQSLLAKSQTALSQPFSATFASGLLGTLFDFYGAVNLAALAGIAALIAMRRHPVARLAGLWVAAYTAFFVLGKAPNFGWYQTPLLVALLAACGALVGVAAARWLQPGWPRVVGVLLGCALLLAPQLRSFMKLNRDGIRSIGAIETDAFRFRSAAEAINHADPGAVVASHEVGALGYFLTGRIVDLEGLVTKGTYEALVRGEQPRLDTVEAGWFVHRFSDDVDADLEEQPAWRRARAADFEERLRLHDAARAHTTVVFRRRTDSAP